MRLQSPIAQCFKAGLVLMMACAIPAITASAQVDRPSLPDPVKFVNKFDPVWNVVKYVLDDMGLQTELEDKTGGRITTKPHEFITGSLTSSEVDKVAIKRDSITGTWLKARYVAEVLVEIVTPTQTLVTVHTKMEGLNREIDGSEKWLPLESRGTYERRILGRISMKLLGTETDLGGKKGFWDQTPQSPDARRPSPFPNKPPRQ